LGSMNSLAMLPHLGQVNTTIPLVLPHGAK
jgi:hypothetical protein